ncbi:glucan endo-1,3-beta-D-glucosidase [Synchytrium microbalum]|uniref:glucan endo-1,3-beta-D-glucosidase n=1 Tax=Synchytrium microbalum TaxID=1806994 RepID=A0A507CDF6_9FUNG|nr:glucan endo-1,3-beta-D-glucosidase [Synchytrium microbalum]TPX37531.1 glucan endo-1,3-beta-D-glucosidase [Synchytrium microbalum]
MMIVFLVITLLLLGTTCSDKPLYGIGNVTGTTYSDKPLYGINYGPRRTLNSCPSFDIITSDLVLLSNLTNRIKTFGLIDSGTGMASVSCPFGELVLKAADVVKMKADDSELKRLVSTHPNLFENVDSVVVGSETLFRGEETQQTLAERVTKVRNFLHSNKLARITVTAAEINLPFYGDVLIAAVDYLLVNVYPYWEGRASATAPQLQITETRDLASRGQGKPLVLGEVGWPTGGDAFRDALPSLSNLEQYCTTWVRMAKTNNMGHFFFEAFDESWKPAEHGGVEQHWGLYYSNRTVKSMQCITAVSC